MCVFISLFVEVVTSFEKGPDELPNHPKTGNVAQEWVGTSSPNTTPTTHNHKQILKTLLASGKVMFLKKCF